MTLPTTRSDLVGRIAPLLAQLGGPSTDAAVHSLTELREALPLLVEEYHRESEAERRRLLIHCLWQYRDPGVIPTLAAALDDANDRVWKESLDGLVTLGTGEALVILENARQQSEASGPDEKRQWIAEAIQQVRSGNNG